MTAKRAAENTPAAVDETALAGDAEGAVASEQAVVEAPEAATEPVAEPEAEQEQEAEQAVAPVELLPEDLKAAIDAAVENAVAELVHENERLRAEVEALRGTPTTAAASGEASVPAKIVFDIDRPDYIPPGVELPFKPQTTMYIDGVRQDFVPPAPPKGEFDCPYCDFSAAGKTNPDGRLKAHLRVVHGIK